MGNDGSEGSKLVGTRAKACEQINHVRVPQRARNLLSIIEIIGYWEGLPFPEVAFFFFFFCCGQTPARTSSFMRFLDHTQGRTTVGRTPLDESSARRRDV